MDSVNFHPLNFSDNYFTSDEQDVTTATFHSGADTADDGVVLTESNAGPSSFVHESGVQENQAEPVTLQHVLVSQMRRAVFLRAELRHARKRVYHLLDLLVWVEKMLVDSEQEISSFVASPSEK